MKARITFLALAMLAGGSAWAEGFYAGAGIGITQIEDEEGGLSFEDNPFGWRLIAGYDFNENFAIEGSYIDSGEAEDSVQGVDVEAELTAFTVSAVGLLPLNDTTTLFGKLGLYSGESEVSAAGLSEDDDEDGLTVGGGVRFRTTDQLTIRAEFDWFDTDLDTVWSIGVGFQYGFGG